MRKLRGFVAVLVLVALGAGAATAAEKANGSALANHDVAVFSVPGLKGDVVKSLAKALADEPGIVRAKADRKQKTFLVTFDRSQTNPEAILGTVSAVAKDATLVSVAPADPKATSGSDCGKCPRARSCPGTKK